MCQSEAGPERPICSLPDLPERGSIWRKTRPQQGRLRVVIATPLGRGGRGGIDRLNDMIIDRFDVPDSPIAVEQLVTRGQGAIGSMPLVFLRSIVQLARTAIGREVDVMHLCVSVYGSAYRKIVLGELSRLFGITYVVHLHGGGFDEWWLRLGLRGKLIDRLFLNSAEIIVLGDYWAEVVRRKLPAVRHITVLPNATPRPITTKRTKDGSVHISFVGEVGARKGVPQLLDALGRLAKRPDWRATIAGNGELEKTSARIREMRIDHRVSLPGWLGPAAVADLFGETDIFVLPSFAENLPMSLLEAMSHGLAVVSTPCGCVTEVIANDVNGIIVPFGDAGALYAAIERLIENPALRERLGNAARKTHEERYEIERYCARLAEIWKDTFRRSKGGQDGGDWLQDRPDPEALSR
jgi:glycosyltransferase involved in cell wall biosynthesis